MRKDMLSVQNIVCLLCGHGCKRQLQEVLDGITVGCLDNVANSF